MTATPDSPIPTNSPAGIVVSDACSRFRPTPETTSAWYAALDWCRLRGEGHDPHHAALANLAEKLERERDARYTIEEIAEYIAGWAAGPFDEVERIGAAVLVNSLNQLRDDQDGIEAVRQRRQISSENDPHHPRQSGDEAGSK
jgi:hypothetical protein